MFVPEDEPAEDRTLRVLERQGDLCWLPVRAASLEHALANQEPHGI